MPIAPPATTYECPVCGWSKTVAPKSDCLSRGLDYFDACPKCAHKRLEHRMANSVDALLSKLMQQIKGVLR